MFKNTVKIDGMACGMCEAHISDTIRGALPDAKKVKASRRKKEAVFLTEQPVDKTMMRELIDATGYHFMGMESTEK
ncbi:MAG: heavy-metal-associated domain-containing protein [Lachnospiraceae bacterium]|jgi:copper chaperone CopZ|nr:heavy-metal-associated domain-containing protein [Lachnospiraceae bacterium]MCI1328687.1 heavy-metal-associated domain-containing protein [Lachnospiraceae bacterium]